MPIPLTVPAAGLTPASAWYPVLYEAASLPPVFLADDTGNDGELQSIVEGRDAVDDAVVTAIRAKLNSGSALGRTGNTLMDIDKSLPTTPNAIKFAVDLALKQLTTAGDIGSVSIETETDDYLGAFYLQYVNLRSGLTQKVNL